MPEAQDIYESLGNMMKTAPFQPFDIRTADGDTIHVEHPDFVARSPGASTTIVYDREGHFRIINLDMVVTLEPSRAKPTRKAAGKE